jgi:hypothetical protein
MSFCTSHILVWLRRTVARLECELVSDKAMKPKILTERVNGCSSYTHLYPTFLALHAASARLSMRYHLRSSELCSLPLVTFVTAAHCPGFGALPSAVSLMMDKAEIKANGWKQKVWPVRGGTDGCGLAILLPDSGQGDSSSLELYHSDRVLPHTRILASCLSSFWYYDSPQ